MILYSYSGALDLSNINDESVTYELVTEWLKEYISSKSSTKKAKLKALIVTKMIPIIKRIARTIARRAYDPVDDLIQAGSIGLLKAIDSYSSNISDNFKIYAGYLIIGEMKHYLRDKLNTIRIPAHIQELSFRINSFTSTLTLEELNNLTNDDVAEALNVAPKAINIVQQTERRKKTISLEEMYNLHTDNLSYEEMLADSSSYEHRDLDDLKIIIQENIEKLPDDCIDIVKKMYYEDMSQKEIAKVMNLSRMQVNRRVKKAFGILYKEMEAYKEQ